MRCPMKVICMGGIGQWGGWVAFIGLLHEYTRPKRFKATKNNLCDVVENWRELCEEFYGCDVWRNMLTTNEMGAPVSSR